MEAVLIAAIALLRQSLMIAVRTVVMTCDQYRGSCKRSAVSEER